MPPRPQPEAAAREHIDALVVAAGCAIHNLEAALEQFAAIEEDLK